MKLVPLYNKVIVEILPPETNNRTASGIYIPNKPTPYYKGKVLSVGKGHYQNAQRISMDVKEGDVILFLTTAGMGVEFDAAGNPTQVLLADTDIYAVVEE